MGAPARRRFLSLLAGLTTGPHWLVGKANAQPQPGNQLEPLIARLTGGKPVGRGRVSVNTPRLADNGHSVPLTVSVTSPMTKADYVRS